MLRKIILFALVIMQVLTMTTVFALADDTATVQKIALSDQTVTTHGRTYYGDDGLHMNWTASGFSFTFTGTTVTMDITASAIAGQPFLRVYVDGVALDRDLAISNRSYTVRLVSGLEDTTHTVKVLKRTENGWGGMMTVHNLNVTGTMGTPPAPSSRKVEVIGDSITCGYGNLIGDKAPTNAYSATRQDGLSTFATLAIEPYGADIQIISKSGIGFGCNNGGGKTDTMLDAYDCTDYFNLGATVKWDFVSNPADVVIIALGTNDTANSDSNDYEEKAYQMLELVRKKNPDAYIIWAYGMMTASRADVLMQVCNELNDDKIFYHALPMMDKNNHGDAGHPSMASHVAASVGLCELIGEITGWKRLDEPLFDYGDVDTNETVTANDALMVLKSVVGKTILTQEQIALADVNGDGVVSAADALMILQKIVGKINRFPVES